MVVVVVVVVVFVVIVVVVVVVVVVVEWVFVKDDGCGYINISKSIANSVLFIVIEATRK